MIWMFLPHSHLRPQGFLAKRRAASWAAGDRKALLEQVRRLTGIRRLSELSKPSVEVVGTIARASYKIEKLLIRPEEGVWLL
jgi:hypothetical protein